MKKTGWTTFRFDDHCTDCGCTISAKGRCLSCKCPKGKWLAVVEEEENIKIKELIHNGR